MAFLILYIDGKSYVIWNEEIFSYIPTVVSMAAMGSLAINIPLLAQPPRRPPLQNIMASSDPPVKKPRVSGEVSNAMGYTYQCECDHDRECPFFFIATPFVCQLCMTFYHTPGHLRRHLVMKHGRTKAEALVVVPDIPSKVAQDTRRQRQRDYDKKWRDSSKGIEKAWLQHTKRCNDVCLLKLRSAVPFKKPTADELNKANITKGVGLVVLQDT